MSMTQEQINADVWAECKRMMAEVATLRAKAEAYDNGVERLAVYNGKGHFMWTDNYTTTNEQAGLPVGCQLRKVRVCEEVDMTTLNDEVTKLRNTVDRKLTGS